MLLAGDLNAESKPAPDQSKLFSLRGTYAPLTWNAARTHRLALKSVYHDDIGSIIGINGTVSGAAAEESGDLVDGSSASASAGASTGDNTIPSMRAVSVSYTHLTLPTKA